MFVRDRAFLQQHAARLVPYLVCRADDPEQLVDAHRGEEREAAQPAGELGGRQRLAPQLAPALGRHTLLGERPRGGLEDVPVADVAMGEHVFDVAGERPHFLLGDQVDRRRRDHLIVVVDQLQQRFLDVPRPRLDQHVAAPHLLLERQVFQQRHDLLAQVAR